MYTVVVCICVESPTRTHVSKLTILLDQRLQRLQREPYVSGAPGPEDCHSSGCIARLVPTFESPRGQEKGQQKHENPQRARTAHGIDHRAAPQEKT